MRTLRLIVLPLLAICVAIGLLSPPSSARPVDTIVTIHEDHGHQQWNNGQGTIGHTWPRYMREAAQLRAYLRAAARNKMMACSRDPHCAVRLASFMHHGPYRLIDSVVTCESGYNPAADNTSSTAGGLFQFLEGTWESSAPSFGMGGRSRYEVWPAAWVGSGMIAQGGIGHWAASQGCWGVN